MTAVFGGGGIAKLVVVVIVTLGIGCGCRRWGKVSGGHCPRRRTSPMILGVRCLRRSLESDHPQQSAAAATSAALLHQQQHLIQPPQQHQPPPQPHQPAELRKLRRLLDWFSFFNFASDVDARQRPFHYQIVRNSDLVNPWNESPHTQFVISVFRESLPQPVLFVSGFGVEENTQSQGSDQGRPALKDE